MECRVVNSSGSGTVPLERAAIEDLLGREFFWLDVPDPTKDDLALLGDVFDFHPLALEDSAQFDQRPKQDDYGTFAFLVLYGHAPDADMLVEVHLYVTKDALVTIHREGSPTLDKLHAAYDRHDFQHDGVTLTHLIADGLVDSFFPAITMFDDRLDLIEDQIVLAPTRAHLQELFAIRRRLASLRHVLGPQRDVIGTLASGTETLPGMTPEHEHYFRDVHDHLLRLAEQLEVTHDVISTATEVYLSAQSNRMNDVMRQLTLIATIFLPLTFITGFFGQNFGWMVRHIGSWETFVLLGLGAQVVCVAILYGLFRRERWF
jgi:magnesium transporter